jgi:hypothetical protein
MPTETKTQMPFTDPMTAFQKLMTDAMVRMASFAEEYAALEAQMLARAQAVIATWGQLAQDGLVYSAQLSAQARKLGVDTARKFQA